MPTGAKAGAGGVDLTWAAEAAIESGLRGFVILRNGKEVAALPEKPRKQAGRALFRGRSYHDTPEKPLPAMRYVDKAAKSGEKPIYAGIAVNGAGLKSDAAKAVLVAPWSAPRRPQAGDAED